MVMPAAATSHCRVLRNAPVLKFSKGVSRNACLAPSFLAALSTMSTSKPTTFPFCSNWNGGYGRWVQVVSTPGLASPDALCCPPLELPPEPPPPHAARTHPEATSDRTDRLRADMASG